ncbi:allantoicase [Nocardia sp. NPDC003963]
MVTDDFRSLPDLASRSLAGSVVFANDELFAERENLIKPGAAQFAVDDFGHKGKVYDGWETRRRREPGSDCAIVRLGVPGVVRGVVIDTAWFKGNYPPHASVEAASLEGYPSTCELDSAEWTTIVPKSALAGDRENPFRVAGERRFTHIRLSIYPDGGVARFRVHGEPMPDPRLLTGTVDLAALENGADVVGCSDMFYSSPLNLLRPDRARRMGDGWENARRRDGGNDFVTVRLAAVGRIRRVEMDTSYFVGNAPGWASLRGWDESRGGQADESAWIELVARTRLQPDTRHHFRVASDTAAVSHIRLDVFPDGGLARLRVHGELTEPAFELAIAEWLNAMPADHAVAALVASGTVSGEDAHAVLAGGPVDASAQVVRRLSAAYTGTS